MAECVPILIGITGKRDLKGEDDVVRERLRAAFDTLDRESPNAPKVLLSGMAIGADTMAAELALARPNWLVAAVLPFDAETYFEDFDGAALAALKSLLADPRVKSCALPPLTNPYTGAPCTRDELRNSANASNPLRVMHYEQLGLWLAQAATLLVAVMPESELPDQVGGTARVVQYRLSGRPDTVATRVMETSAVVVPPRPLDIAALGPLWLIEAPGGESSSRLFTAYLGEADRKPAPEPPDRVQRLESSLIMVHAFEGLAWRSGHDTGTFDWRSDGADPSAIIAAIHAELDRIQGRHKRRLVSSSYALAVLFWLAVGAFGLVELTRYVTGNLSLISLVAYLLLAGAAVGVHWAVDHFRWQRITEDYRGVIEALRVQEAWWHAGLLGPADETERFYLSATPPPFVYVRQAVRSIVRWARLSGAPHPPRSDWREVYDGDENDEEPHSWIGGQIDYFRRRGEERKRAVARTQMISWEWFFAAVFLAVWLLADIAAARWYHERLDELSSRVRNWGLLLPGLFLAAAALTWAARHRHARSAPLKRRWAAIFAVALALLVGPGLHLLGLALPREVPHGDQLAIAFGIVLLSAGAAAVRYVAEKLVWEAEAHRYEATLTLFQRAAAELTHIGMPSDASRAIVRALGRAALEENEYWLRAHRERPVEQAVG